MNAPPERSAPDLESRVMAPVGHAPHHPGAHRRVGDHHQVKQFWIALVLATVTALGAASLVLALAMAVLTVVG